MSNEELYLYYYPKQTKEADRIDITVDNLGYTVHKINLDAEPDCEKRVKEFCDKDNSCFPILQVGDEKIRAVLFRPSDKMLTRFFESDSGVELALPKPTVYSGTWCGDCHLLRDWFEDREIKFKEINIDEKANIADKLVKWSGGRRVLPTIEFKGVARLFNPGIEVMTRLFD